MKWQSLKRETQELVANSVEIYNSLMQKGKLYKQDSVIAVSLYSGILRMGNPYQIKSKRQIIVSGSEKPQYRLEKDNYDNRIYQLLSENGITIADLIQLLELNERLVVPTSSIHNSKIESRYHEIYKNLLGYIRDCYYESNKQKIDRNYQNINMTPANIINAIHCPNIEPTNSVGNLLYRLSYKVGSPVGLSDTGKPSYLSELESLSTYTTVCAIPNSDGTNEICSVEKPLIMSKSIGKII